MHLAVLNGHRDVAALLIGNGAQVESPDDRGMTAMHHAIGHTPCLQLLIENKAEIDCVGQFFFFFFFFFFFHII